MYRCRLDGLIYSCSGGRTEEQLLKWFEPDVKAELAALTAGDFLDIGGNIGLYTVSVARQLGAEGRVVAMEPHPIYARLLKRTAAENGLENVKVIQAAAWSKADELTLYEHVFGGDRLGSSVIQRVSSSSLTVPAKSVDEVVTEEGLEDLTAIKVDAEGAEVEIFEGMQDTLSGNPQLRIIFEALNPRKLRACKEILDRYGFRIRRLKDRNHIALGPRA